MTERTSPRILICRLSHIGDCILTLPVLNTLRAHFPNAFLAWVVESPTDQLLRNHPALDHLIVLPRGWMKSVPRVRQLRRELRQLRLDITIDPQSLTKSALVAWLSGARRRLGMARGPGRELAPWLNTQLVLPRQTHLVDRSLELLEGLGIRVPQTEFCLRVDRAARRAMDDYITQAHLACGFAVLNPGAGWHSRRWPAAWFASVARYLGQNRSLPSVVTWAGQEEEGWAKSIVASAGGHALLAPPTTLMELAALLQSAVFYVGSDTGPLHLAAAVGTTCIGLYGPTRPQDSGAYGNQHVAVQACHQPGTRRQRRTANNDAMHEIEPEMVCRACDQVLAGLVAEGQTHAA